MQTYRTGLIGCGRVGSLLDDEVFDRRVSDESWRTRPCTYAGNFADHPRVQLVAACDVKPGRLERMRVKWGVDALYTDYRTMLEKERLDVVAVATGSSLHHRMVIDAADAGVRAVFCEKPIADSLMQADEMVEACARTGTRLTINHNFRFLPDLPPVKTFIDSGGIGRLTTAVCHFDHWLLHMGTHVFDLLCLFAGEPALVYGHLDGDATQDTGGSGHVCFKSGVHALIDVRTRTSFSYLDLMGEKGVVRFCNDLHRTWELWLPEKGSRRHASARLVPAPFPWMELTSRRGSAGEGQFVCPRAVDEVVASLDEARESCSNAREAREALEIAFGMYRSHLAGGCAMKLPNEDRSPTIPEAVPAWVQDAHEAI